MKNILNRPEKLTLGFTEDNLAPLKGDEEVKLEPEKTCGKSEIKSSKKKK